MLIYDNLHDFSNFGETLHYSCNTIDDIRDGSLGFDNINLFEIFSFFPILSLLAKVEFITRPKCTEHDLYYNILFCFVQVHLNYKFPSKSQFAV